MRTRLFTLLLIAFLLGAPAFAYSEEPISFKIKYQVKRIVLFAPRTTRFLLQGYGIRDSLGLAMYCEAINLRCRGQGWESFELWSWGD